MTKMTQKVALEIAVKVMEEQEQDAQAIETLKKMIFNKEKQAQREKEKRNKKKEENAGLLEIVKKELKKENGATIAELKEVDGLNTFSTQKISALITRLKATEDIKTLADGHKKRYVIG